MSREEETASKFTHRILNLFGPIQTLLDVIDLSSQDPKIKNLHQTCKENLKTLLELVQRIKV